MNKQTSLLTLLGILLVGLGAHIPQQSLASFPSALGVGDMAIWESEGHYIGPIRAESHRVIIDEIDADTVWFRKAYWYSPPENGSWHEFSLQRESNHSNVYWLDPDAVLNDTLLDFIYIDPIQLITNISEGIEEVTGQSSIYVESRNPYTGRGWNIHYDASALLALKMQRYRPANSRLVFWTLLNTSVDLGPPATTETPAPIPGFPPVAAALAIVTGVVLGVLRRKRRG